VSAAIQLSLTLPDGTGILAGLIVGKFR